MKSHFLGAYRFLVPVPGCEYVHNVSSFLGGDLSRSLITALAAH